MKEAYPRLTVDPVVFCYNDDMLKVLLVKRKDNPDKGRWALPGAHSYEGQLMKDSLDYGLSTKTGVRVQDLSYVEQLHTFDTTGLDPRGHAVTVTFLGLTNSSCSLTEGSQFVSVDDLDKVELAFDHRSIIDKARERLVEKLEKTSIAVYIMPRSFTLNQLFRLYEAAYGRNLDNRNFRKKYLSLKVLKETGRLEQGVSHRPSKYMSYKKPDIEFLITSF